MDKKAIDGHIKAGRHIRRKNTDQVIFWMIAFLIVACLIYYILPDLRFTAPLHDIYIQMVIFLFATIVGFSVNRQHARYREIISQLTEFDGGMSAMYREFSYFCCHNNYQQDFENIVSRHYTPVIENHSWDYNLVNKSTTLSATYDLISKVTHDHKLSDVERMSASEIKKLLADMQKNRKELVALHTERVQDFQWFVVYFLCLVLVVTIASANSYGLFLESLLKAAFTTAVISTAVLLRKLDNLDLFESFIGERSAKDVLDIIHGVK